MMDTGKTEFQMKDIRDYAKKNKLSIKEACMLFETATKIVFYDELLNKIGNKNPIAAELYASEEHPVTVKLEGYTNNYVSMESPVVMTQPESPNNKEKLSSEAITNVQPKENN